MLLQAATSATDLPGGYGAALLQTLLALAAVCILAWVVLRWAAQRGIGSGQRIRVIERAPLDARRSLYLVRVGARVLLVGAGDGGAPALLCELSASELEGVEPSKVFEAALARASDGATSPEPTPPTREDPKTASRDEPLTRS